MDAEAVQQVLDVVFDQALVHHGFTSSMRDDELIVYCTADPRTGIAPAHERLLFTKCVEATTTTALSRDVWALSLDDRLTDLDTGVELDGYVWGVEWQELYPGGAVVAGSHAAARWSEALGETFHEVRIEANAHVISLVFVDVLRETVGPGHAPFVVTEP